MPELNTDTDALRLFRAIRGAPATILFLLLVRGVSMTNLEICRYTGYSDKPVTAALDVLMQLGILQYNGRHNGWSLQTGSQLLLPFTHLLHESYPQPVEKEIGESPIYNPQIGKFPIYALTTTTTTIDPLDLGYGSSSSSSNIDRKISDLPINTNGHNGNGHHHNGNSGTTIAPPHPTDPRVAHWLQRAGVGEKSRKYRELLNADLDWHTVRAHALERLAQPQRVQVGLFIRRLLDGDPPPAPRCPDCYSPLNDYGQCSSILCGY